jgi:hypothetical protein
VRKFNNHMVTQIDSYATATNEQATRQRYCEQFHGDLCLG